MSQFRPTARAGGRDAAARRPGTGHAAARRGGA